MRFATDVKTLAPRTLRLCVALLIGVAGSFFVPGWLWLGLTSCEASWAKFTVSLFGHAAVFGSLAHWLGSSLALTFTALAVEKNFSNTRLALLWLGALASDGVAYLITADSCRPLVGPSAIAVGYIGSALVLIPLTWARSHLILKIYFYVCLAFIATLLFEHWRDVLAPAATMVFGAGFTYFAAARASSQRHEARGAA